VANRSASGIAGTGVPRRAVLAGRSAQDRVFIVFPFRNAPLRGGSLSAMQRINCPQ
jgi:hypothetical protein